MRRERVRNDAGKNDEQSRSAFDLRHLGAMPPTLTTTGRTGSELLSIPSIDV